MRNRLAPVALVLILTMAFAGAAFACDANCTKPCCAPKAADGAAEGASAQAAPASSGKVCTKSASAGKSCAAKSASAGKSCTAAKGASTMSASAEMAGCPADCAKACCSQTAYVFSVSGMTCGGCVSAVEKAVAALDLKNMNECTVSLEENQAVLVAKGAVDTDAVAEAITKAGFASEFVPEEETDAGMAEEAGEEATM